MKYTEVLLEYDRNKTIEKFKDKLVSAMKRDVFFYRSVSTDFTEQQQLENFIEQLEDMDPTSNKQWTVWIVNQYIKNAFRIEDKARVRSTLDEFKKLRTPIKRAGYSVDINQYTWRTLVALIDELTRESSETPEISTEYQYGDEMRILSKTAYGVLAVPLTERASCELGKGTRWCTAASVSDNMFDSYNQEGPLYIWIDKNGDKYQFHFESNQYMDSSDMSLPEYYPDKFLYFATEHPIVSKLFAKKIAETPATKNYQLIYEFIGFRKRIPMVEPYILEQSQGLISEYALKNIQGRWPEGEDKLFANVRKSGDNQYDAYTSLKKYYNEIYVRFTKQTEWPEYEAVLSANKNNRHFLDYVIQNRAKPDVLRRLVTKAIADGRDDTANTVLEYLSQQQSVSRLPALEKVLDKTQDPVQILKYMRIITKHTSDFADGWKLFEQSIKNQPANNSTSRMILNYLMEYRPTRWPEGEKKILANAYMPYIFKYAFEIIKGRWTEAEPKIIDFVKRAKNIKGLSRATSESQSAVFDYVLNCVKDRWPEIEPYIVDFFEEEYIMDYLHRFTKERVPVIEKSILASSRADSSLGTRYVLEIMNRGLAKGSKPERWIELENTMFREKLIARLIIYFRRVINYGNEVGEYERWPKLERLIDSMTPTHRDVYKKSYDTLVGIDK